MNALKIVGDLRRCWRLSDSNELETPQMFRLRFRNEYDKRKLKKDKERSSKWMRKTSRNWIKMLINSEVLSSVTFTVCCSRSKVQKHKENFFGFKNFLEFLDLRFCKSLSVAVLWFWVRWSDGEGQLQFSSANLPFIIKLFFSCFFLLNERQTSSRVMTCLLFCHICIDQQLSFSCKTFNRLRNFFRKLLISQKIWDDGLETNLESLKWLMDKLNFSSDCSETVACIMTVDRRFPMCGCQLLKLNLVYYEPPDGFKMNRSALFSIVFRGSKLLMHRYRDSKWFRENFLNPYEKGNKIRPWKRQSHSVHVFLSFYLRQ